MVKIRFSSALSNVTHARETTLELGNTTVKAVLDKLVEQYGADFEKRILDRGEVRRFVNLYVNGEDIRHLSGLDSPVKDADEISILPAVSGGGGGPSSGHDPENVAQAAKDRVMIDPSQIE